MANIGIYYGSSTGNTENAAEQIAQAFGGDAETAEISAATEDDILAHDFIIFGASTWGTGDLQDDFEDFMGTLEGMDFSGKKVAVFGLGDQENYPDTFVDAIGTIAKAVQAAGGTIVGKVATEGYTYDESTAEEGGQFLGLPLDEDNESDKTSDRITNWVSQLKQEFA